MCYMGYIQNSSLSFWSTIKLCVCMLLIQKIFFLSKGHSSGSKRGVLELAILSTVISLRFFPQKELFKNSNLILSATAKTDGKIIL